MFCLTRQALVLYGNSFPYKIYNLQDTYQIFDLIDKKRF